MLSAHLPMFLNPRRLVCSALGLASQLRKQGEGWEQNSLESWVTLNLQAIGPHHVCEEQRMEVPSLILRPIDRVGVLVSFMHQAQSRP